MYKELSKYQTTFQKSVSMDGIALHAGVPASAILNSAPVNTGIVFRRQDIKDKNNIVPALYTNIVDTRLCSCFGNADGVTVSLTEHLMATLHAFGITNAFIDVTGPEVPILDGCANGYVKYFEQAGIEEQNEKKRILKIKKEVTFTDDKGNKILIQPAEYGFTVDFEIDFPAKSIGYQHLTFEMSLENFKNEIAYARTFGQKQEIEMLRSMGLARGGSLENAVLVDNDTIVNPEGLRDPLEFVRHKILDCVGDLYQAGMPIIGSVKASKTGHFHNNMLLREVFKDESNYEVIVL